MDSLNASIASLDKLKWDQQTSHRKRTLTEKSDVVSPLTLTPQDAENNDGFPVKSGSKQSGAASQKLYSRRQRIFLTICVYLSFYSLGMLCNILGPTLVHMTFLLNVDMATISLAFTCEWCGYLLGSLLGGITYDHFNEELQFSIFTFLMGITTILCPWAETVYWFFAYKALQALMMGYLDMAAHVYIISIWNGHRLKQAMHQTMMTIYSIGAFTGPLITAPFLIDLPEENCVAVTNGIETMNISSSDINTNKSSDYITEAPDPCSINGIELVRHGYAVSGLLAIVWSFVFVVAFFVMTPSIRRPKERKPKTVTSMNNYKNESKNFRVTMLVIIFLLSTFHTFIIIPGWISSFVLKGLYWEAKKGPLITSVYWISNLIGRIVSIPLSMVLSPGKMVSFYMSGTSITLVLTIIVSQVYPDLLWFSIALVGFTLSTTFGTSVMWLSQHMSITGVVSSVLLCGFSAGFMTAGAIAGYLFQHYSAFWVLYISLIASFVQMFLFIMANVLVKCSSGRRKETVMLEVK